MRKNKEDVTPIIIRKKKVMHGHHGGAWKVAFADFMTAMFALFLVLWLVNQSSDVKSAIAGYFQDPLGRADEYGSSIIAGDGAQSQAVRRAMISDDVLAVRRDRLMFSSENIEQRLLDSAQIEDIDEHIEITLTNEGLRIELIEDEGGFWFEKGRAKPSRQGAEIFAVLGKEFGKLTLPLRIEGHTDSTRFGNSGYTNWELSADRANSARRIMERNGLQLKQVRQVRAFADTYPKVVDDPGSPRNRRVTIMVLLNDPGELKIPGGP